MQYKYVVPKVIVKEVEVDGKKSETKIETCLKGHIVIDVPGFSLAAKIAKDIRYKLDQSGEMKLKTDDEVAQSVMELIPVHIKEVDVQDLDGNFKFQNSDDLGATVEGKEVLIDSMKIIMQGIKLGKK